MALNPPYLYFRQHVISQRIKSNASFTTLGMDHLYSNKRSSKINIKSFVLLYMLNKNHVINRIRRQIPVFNDQCI